MLKYFKSFLHSSGKTHTSAIPRNILTMKGVFSVKKSFSGDWFVLLDDNYVMVSNTEFEYIHFLKVTKILSFLFYYVFVNVSKQIKEPTLSVYT